VPPTTIAGMKNQWMQSCGGARKIATLANFVGKNAIPFATLSLLLFSILSSSGCIGLTSASKAGSGQQTTPGAATISVQPSSIKFGSVSLGGTASQSVTMSNGGGSDLKVTQVSTTSAGVTVTGISLPLTVGAGKQATFNVIFSPKTPGALSGNVSILSDVSTSPSTVSLSGTGLAATAFLSSSDSTLNFGNVVLGKSSGLPVTLTNAGNSNVTVSKVTVMGASYSATGVSAGLILAPGQSVQLDATFAPLTAGVFPGSVTVTSNATNSPANISLSGDATQASLHSVALTWAPSTSTVAGYNVYRSDVSGGPYSKLDSSLVAMDSYTDSTVQAGKTYYFVVTSVTAAGSESSDSTEASATVPTP
jgi:hypothetical protein